MDFVHDMLHDGRRIRMLNVVDDCTRECLAIETDTSLPGTRVIEVLERLRDQRGLPRAIVARQRTRVRRACAGSVGARARAQDRLHPAG